ncbi:MAG: guanylate kinase [Methyloprofundus sp.]|nr:guanylate kinase [Methyloprofundus sp.]
MNQGKLYIISAPSGAGKTSLIKQLLPQVEKLMVSISHTTRAQREGEQDGVDYFFTSVEVFKSAIAQGDFLEYAQVFDNFYGTAQSSVEASLKQGLDVILEIDWQGAEQIRKLLPDTLSIFIVPPSNEALRERLQGRGQDSDEIINRRMQDAVNEMSHYAEYDYLVVNDDFNTALVELQSIILANRLHIQRQQTTLAPLLTSLIN